MQRPLTLVGPLAQHLHDPVGVQDEDAAAEQAVAGGGVDGAVVDAQRRPGVDREFTEPRVVDDERGVVPAEATVSTPVAVSSRTRQHVANRPASRSTSSRFVRSRAADGSCPSLT